MKPRHVRLLFVPVPEQFDGLNRSAVLPLRSMRNADCNGRSAPGERRVRAVLVRDERVAHLLGARPCRAQLHLSSTFSVARH